MNITSAREAGKLTIALEGRLDTITAPLLDEALSELLTPDVTEMVFDLEKLEYVSSAGLRVILAVQKCMEQRGGMVVRNANETIMEVFEVTGFIYVLTIE